MDAVTEIGRNPASDRFSLRMEKEQADAEPPNPSRETKFSDANGDR